LPFCQHFFVRTFCVKKVLILLFFFLFFCEHFFVWKRFSFGHFLSAPFFLCRKFCVIPCVWMRLFCFVARLICCHAIFSVPRLSALYWFYCT
jgi:hypothetical protein